MKSHFTVVSLWLLLQFSSFGTDEITNKIAEVFGYPPERLTTQDLTEEAARKSKSENYLLSLRLTSQDQTFAPTQLGISKRGTMLTPEKEAYCEKVVSERVGLFKRFELTGGGYGYTGLGMAGPGGSQQMVLATWPERGIDLVVSMTFDREGLPSEEETRDYHELVMQGGEPLDKALIQAVTQLANHADEEQIYGSPKPRNETPAESSFPAAAQSGRPAKDAPNSTIAPDVPQNRLWIWIAGISAASVTMAFMFKRRS